MADRIALTVYDDGGTVLCEVAGWAGHPPFFVFLSGDSVRTLWPVRGLPVRLPERPLGAAIRAVMAGAP